MITHELPHLPPVDKIRLRNPLQYLVDIISNLIISGIQEAEIQALKRNYLHLKEHVHPQFNAAGDLGSKNSPAFRELHSIVSAMCHYHAYGLKLPITLPVRSKPSNNTHNLRKFYIREQLKKK